jgi:hypothetical protein
MRTRAVRFHGRLTRSMGRTSINPVFRRARITALRNHPAYADVYVTTGVLRGASPARVGHEEPRVRLAGKNPCGARSGATQ